jgi:hypothetical protein
MRTYLNSVPSCTKELVSLELPEIGRVMRGLTTKKKRARGVAPSGGALDITDFIKTNGNR